MYIEYIKYMNVYKAYNALKAHTHIYVYKTLFIQQEYRVM